MKPFYKSKKAMQEVFDHNLGECVEYLHHTANYVRQYTKRPPGDNIFNTNMIKALRMAVWQNTPEDWARLHVTEAFLNNRSKRNDTEN